MRLTILLSIFAAVVMTSQGLAAGTPEPIEIPLADGGKLKAMLFRPDGTGPHPAVIGLHNCTGLINSRSVIGARYSDWGRRLAADGFAVVLPDSHGSRGLGS